MALSNSGLAPLLCKACSCSCTASPQIPSPPSHLVHCAGSPQAERHWSRALTDKVTSVVKLVGATISCEPTSRGGGERRSGPHVQSYAVATDAVRSFSLLYAFKSLSSRCQDR